MKRLVSTFLFLFIATACWAQFFTGATSNLYIGSRSKLFVGPEATFNGNITNLGELILNSPAGGQNVFDNVTSGGSVTLSGDGPITLSTTTLGPEFELTNLSVKRTGTVAIETNPGDTLKVNGTLTLQTGSILDASNGNLHVTSGNVVIQDVADGATPTRPDIGASDFRPNLVDTYIRGKLTLTNGQNAASDLNFPMGTTSFNGIKLSNVPAGGQVTVTTKDTLIVTDPFTLRDSISAVSDTKWIIKFDDGFTGNTLTPTIGFSGQNFNVINDSVPKVVFYDGSVVYLDDVGDYRSLGVSNEQTGDLQDFGVSEAAIDISALNGDTVVLAIGRTPSARGLQFYVPNTFAPDGLDPDNQVFRPFMDNPIEPGSLDIGAISMRVWDKYNKLIYKLDLEAPVLADIGWDGRMPSGLPAATGVYYYTVSMQVFTEVFKSSGTVLLMR